MAILTVDCDEQSNFYAVTETGLLYFYQDQARDGNGVWAFGGQPQQIGQGWQGVSQIICGDGGVIYAIEIDWRDPQQNGRLLYFKDLARNGTGDWAFGGAERVVHATGWQNYVRVFSGGGGILYAIDSNGDLYYFRDNARDGSPFGGDGKKIGQGWGGLRDVAYGGDGIIYAVTQEGRLLWFRDLARDGTASWANGGQGQEIGVGWGALSRVLSGQDGVLYGITTDGRMLFFRDLARNGTGVWANGGQEQQIGAGWFVGWQESYAAGYLANTNVAGYAWPMSAGPGERIGFYVSALETYTTTYLRLKVTADAVGQPVAPSFGGAAIPQGTPPLPWQHGCGWSETFALDITEDWVPGLYSAQCIDTAGAVSHIVFTVKPSDRRADFAVLTCSNTLSAYNAWGGRSKYSPGGHSVATLSFQRPNPLSAPVDAAPKGQNGYGMPEFWTLNWMEDQGYNADVYTETDFESGIPWLQSYKALILNNHPEYWTDIMRDRLDTYLAGGGNLLYVGGNGLFERCIIQDGGTSLLFYDGNPPVRDPHYFLNAPSRPERAVLGVGFLYEPNTAAPYKVVNAAHRFFRGTGLNNCDLFGQDGRNGAASGWEMDSSEAGTQPEGVVVSAHEGNDRGAPPVNFQLLAVGTNTVGGAHMVYYRHPGGGIVFSVGSLNFTGSLADDPTVQRIVANVLDECRDPSLGTGQ
jgi:N,N-dimethylformamidase